MFACNKRLKQLLQCPKSLGFLAFLFLSAITTKAQFTSTWDLTTAVPSPYRSAVVAGLQAANVTAGNMVPGDSVAVPGTHNTDGYMCAITSSKWPSNAKDGFHLDFPLSPNGSFDMLISGLTLTVKTSGGSGANMIALAYQVDGAGAWTSFGTPQTANSGGTTNISFGTLSTTLTNGHTYVIRMYVYASGTSTTSSRKAYVKNVVFSGSTVPGGPPPTVITTSASATGRTTATASGNITLSAGTTVSGICWSTSANPTDALTTKTTNGPTSGTFTHPITGLIAGTLYHVRAYATNAVGTSYGDDLTFTTDPAVLATLTTNTTSNITIFSATSGGNISDDGGVAVTARGVCWSTSSNPTIANSTTTDGTGTGSFVSSISGLQPSITYHVRAYATNSVGTAYGNEQTFTTPAPSPTLVATPTTLAFGSILQNTASSIQTFSLTGIYLEPFASGNITVAAPVGFRVSLSSTSGFAPSIQIPFTNGTLASTTIYVKFIPTLVRNYDDSIRCSGTNSNTAYVQVTGTGLPIGLQSGQGFSNKGKEFWVGYGATEQMYSSNNQDLQFTFSNTNSTPATVTISMPNFPTFTPVTYTVPANGSITTNTGDIPESGAEDARLMTEGVFSSGIKITSDTPIVVYCHAITSSVYAASVLFPSQTLGKEYTSLNFTQRSNYSGAKSYLFVVATEDNTTIEVVLPPGVETDTHAAGSTFTQLLNKGQILNIMGKTTGHPNLYTGNDLSGTIVRSISTTSSCKPFAMFCGSSKITIDCDNGSNGSADNLFQQMFPKQAWGTKVVTVPTLPLPINYYRVLVGDPATIVKRNGVVLTGLINNKYYEYQNSTSSVDVLEGDKPIMVSQYMTTHGECGNTSTGSNGDPEMIYLSSVQQTIDTISFVSSPLGKTTGRSHYLNIVMPTSGVSDFKLDNVLQSGAFTTVPFDPSFSYAQISVSEGFHTVTSTSGFNATAYGIANDESYGYNAGTNVKDLLGGFSLQNQFGTGTATNACRDNQFNVRVTLPYKPISITWDFSNNPNLTPNTQYVQNNPLAEDSFFVNNQKLYVFKNPVGYLYHIIGLLPIKVTAVSPIPDGCNGEQQLSFTVNVIQAPTAAFSFTNTGGCLTPPVQFTDQALSNGMTLDLWQWNFGDPGSGANNTSTLQSPAHTFSTSGSYSVTQRVITVEGCYADSTVIISVSAKPTASFSVQPNVCLGHAVTLNNTTSISSGNIAQWNWNFADGSPVLNATSGNNQTHTYTSVGTYQISLTAISTTGCTSVVANQTLVVNDTPTVNAGANISISNGGSVILPATSTIGTYLWTPSNGLSSTSILNPVANPVITTTYLLTVTNSDGCSSSDDITVTVPPSTPCLDPALAFTPNGDGLHDNWSVYTGGCLSQVKVDVYNRWGGLVYHTDRYMNEWDGTYKNQKLPDGTYYYIIKATDLNRKEVVVRGNVTIIR